MDTQPIQRTRTISISSKVKQLLVQTIMCLFLWSFPALFFWGFFSPDYRLTAFFEAQDAISISADGMISFRGKPIDQYPKYTGDQRDSRHRWEPYKSGFSYYESSCESSIIPDELTETYHHAADTLIKKSPVPAIKLEFIDSKFYPAKCVVIQGKNGFIRLAWHGGNDIVYGIWNVSSGSPLKNIKSIISRIPASTAPEQSTINGIPMKQLTEDDLWRMFTWDDQTSGVVHH